MKSLVIMGANGKMGKEISLLAEEAKLKILAQWGRNDQPVNFLEKAEVCIDFSQPEALEKSIAYCKAKAVPLLCGTTGLSDTEFRKMDELAKIVPVLWAANFSIGVQIMKKALQQMAPLSSWDFHIVEAHHVHKKDSPSGTAKVLRATLEESIGKDIPDISAIRGGNVFGMHEVFAMGPDEVITIRHDALSRKVFARGALKAAAFLVGKPAGRYTMEDVLDSLKA